MSQEKQSFQLLQNLAKRDKVKRISTDKSKGAAFLGVLVKDKKYHIPIAQVREIIPKPQIVAIGHAKPWLDGLLKVQGEIYSVIDVAAFLGKGHVKADKNRVVVALSMIEGNYALVVSSVLGITKLGDLQLVDNDEYTVTYQTPEKNAVPALSIPSIIESSELANMSVF